MNAPLYVLRELISNPDKAFTSKELMEITGRNRKAIYDAIASIECAGFNIEVERQHKGLQRYNTYRWTGEIFGADYESY